VTEIGGAVADLPDLPHEALWALADASDVRCPDADAAARIRAAIDAARERGDSLGGCFVVAACGAPIGLGSHVHWERRLDARIAAALVSIQAIKGVEIGPAFENARRPGTQVHDPFVKPGQPPLNPPADRSRPMAHGGGKATFPHASRIGNHVSRTTNRAGGIEGGMTNGQPVVVRAAMKPIPTTITPQRSVDLATGAPAETQYQRSDVCAVPAASIVGEAMLAWVLADALLEKAGGDSITEMWRHLGV
jgi:chorismate synthase